MKTEDINLKETQFKKINQQGKDIDEKIFKC
jgi:hypothetical protein